MTGVGGRRRPGASAVSRRSRARKERAPVRPVTHVRVLAARAPFSAPSRTNTARRSPARSSPRSAPRPPSPSAIATGRFELRHAVARSLSRARPSRGFIASRGADGGGSPERARVTSAIALRHATRRGTAIRPGGRRRRAPDARSRPAAAAAEPAPPRRGTDDHGEIAWRMRHVRRGVLKDATVPVALLVDEHARTEARFGAERSRSRDRIRRRAPRRTSSRTRPSPARSTC